VIYLDTIVGSVYAHKAEWFFKYYDLSAYHLSSSDYQLQISAVDVWPYNAVELGLDVFRLTEDSPTQKDIVSYPSVIVYPNPAHQMFSLESEKPMLQYVLRNVEGKIILNQKLEKLKSAGIPVESMSAGIYFLEVINSDNQRFIKKILVVHP
jgi:hypothetical protein